MQQTFTPAEAASVLGVPLKEVKKALDKGPVRGTLTLVGGSRVRAVKRSDLVYLLAEKTLRRELTPHCCVALHAALSSPARRRRQQVRIGRIGIETADLEKEIDRRTRALRALERGVSIGAGGEPMIKGTTIEVHRIAALLAGGMTVEEVLEDYPTLRREQITNAAAYAEAHPKTGRPYPAITLKRALRQVRLDALDKTMPHWRRG